jgi:hypothetical protein
MEAQLNIVKSLANVTQTVFVLVGTYDLLRLSADDAGLGRRGKDIHFPRYHKHVKSELHEFATLIHSMQGHLPLQVTPDLISVIDFVYERSLGCVGTLKDWLYSALAQSLEDGERRPFKHYLDQTRMPDGKVIASLQEIHEGERAWQLFTDRAGEVKRLTDKDSGYESTEAELAETESYVGFDIRSEGAAARNGVGSSQVEEASPGTRSLKTKPGTRKPARDKVGVDSYAS